MKSKGLFTSAILRSILSLCLIFTFSFASAQKDKKTKDDLKPVKDQTINIHHANSLEFDKRLGEGAQRLIGNVELENAGVVMDCDSAYVYTDNSCRAF
ncbi:MAG TPA: OstA-like protein, partial [Bacteroidia bacterium]|nr:OstA-like protein [Bacteroidia bacterium]